MAESVNKAKAPAKPRKAPAKKAASAAKVATKAPSHEEVAALARKFWAERGHQDGHAEQDWLRAEEELRKQQQ